MNRISRLVIKNFQSHEHTIVDFAEGLNVITGPSDQGKSAIIRAIKWVLFNEPRGMDFIRQGTTTAVVTAEFSNGYKITRERSKSKNRYEIVYPDNSVQNFEGFGNEIPEEVIQAHGVIKILIDSDLDACLNIGDQLEKPFLLSESPSVRAKAIGRLTGLHIIDKASRDCLNDYRKESQNQEKTREEIEDIEASLKNYTYIQDYKERIERCEKYLDEARLLEKRICHLNSLKTSFNRCMSEIKSSNNILDRYQNLDECGILIAEAGEFSKRIERLLLFSEKYNRIKEDIEKAGKALEKTNQLQELSHLAVMIEEKIQVYKNAVQQREKLQANNSNMNEGLKYIENNKKEIKQLSDEFSVILKKLGKCPLCESDISQQRIAGILKHYEEVH